MKDFHIAIDGPAGSGKSTISKALADKFGFIHIDTGAMYRAITYIALKKGIDLTKEKNYHFVQDINVEYKEDKILVDGEDVGCFIRSDEVTKNVSLVSSFPLVRSYLVKIQQRTSKNKKVIMDGRDIGTVVLPNANLKIFLTANLEERSKRRMLELQQKGLDVDLSTVIKDIEKRDEFDSSREFSPLIIAKDAVIIDTTNYSIEETIQRIKEEIEKKEANYGRK